MNNYDAYRAKALKAATEIVEKLSDRRGLDIYAFDPSIVEEIKEEIAMVITKQLMN